MSIFSFHAHLNSAVKKALRSAAVGFDPTPPPAVSAWKDEFAKILNKLSFIEVDAGQEGAIRQVLDDFALTTKRNHRRDDEECLLVIGPRYAALYLINETRENGSNHDSKTNSALNRKAADGIATLHEHESVTQFFRSALGWMPDGERDRGHVEALRQALAYASERGLAGVALNRLFQRALWLCEKTRLETDFFRNPMAVEEVLTEVAGKIFGGLKKRSAMIVGGSEERPRIVEALRQAGIGQLYFISSTPDNEEKSGEIRRWHAEFGGEMIVLPEDGLDLPFTDLLLLFDPSDHRWAERAFWQKLMAVRNSAPLLLADLTNMAAGKTSGIIAGEAVDKLYNLFLFRRQDLQQMVEQNLQVRQQVDSEISKWIQEEVKQFYQWLNSEDRFHFGLMVGRSRQMQRVFELIARIAQNNITVLIEGESGTGKELVARAIHESSRRARRPFVVVNCGALPESLLESELFGHVRGAFTGAVNNKRGLFEEANGGTIFLDEIGEMSPALQVKLLRFLQDGEIKRVGSNAVMKLDVRVIAATNRHLQQMVNEAKFRSDLYYRLNVIQITLPPLRERPEDIKILANHFARKYAERLRKPVSGIMQEAMRQLCVYAWPGNVRELENVMERAVALSTSATIGATELPPTIQEATRQRNGASRPSLKEVERQYIIETVTACHGNYDEAARVLGIGRTTLWRKLKEYKPDMGENGK